MDPEAESGGCLYTDFFGICTRRGRHQEHHADSRMEKGERSGAAGKYRVARRVDSHGPVQGLRCRSKILPVSTSKPPSGR